MEQIRNEVAAEANTQESTNEADKDVRTLKDLEMVLVGGGSDGAVTW